jgi:hypothetical protein
VCLSEAGYIILPLAQPKLASLAAHTTYANYSLSGILRVFVDDDYRSYFPASLYQTYTVGVTFQNANAVGPAWSFSRNLTAAVRGGANHQAVGELAFVEHGLALQAGDSVQMAAVFSRWSHSPGPARNAENWATVGGQVDGLSLCTNGL